MNGCTVSNLQTHLQMIKNGRQGIISKKEKYIAILFILFISYLRYSKLTHTHAKIAKLVV
jgi:hypothetical protein